MKFHAGDRVRLIRRMTPYVKTHRPAGMLGTVVLGRYGDPAVFGPHVVIVYRVDFDDGTTEESAPESGLARSSPLEELARCADEQSDSVQNDGNGRREI